ncbi:MAG: YlzJ-like family protein [Bacillota bacterium]
MNYSIIAEDELTAGVTEEMFTTRQQINVNGVIMEVDLESGELIRIISSNPASYLLYQPGLQISFQPQIR